MRIDKANRNTDMTAWWVYLGHKHGLALDNALMPTLFGVETYWQSVELWRAMGGAGFAHRIPKDMVYQSLIRPEWIRSTHAQVGQARVLQWRPGTGKVGLASL